MPNNQETKIGKVVKHLSKKAITEFDISVRCRKLTDKWISELHDSLVATVDSTSDESKEIFLKDEVEEAPLSSKAGDPVVPQSPKKDVQKLPGSPVKASLIES
jgi:hypothetical protein